MSTRASTRKRKATSTSSTRSTKKTKSSSDDGTYQVDALVDHRPDKDRGGYQYSVKWTGYDDPTWVHESDIVGINLIADYWHEVAQRVEARLAEIEARERDRGGARSLGAGLDDDVLDAAAVPARASSVDAPPVAANAPIDLVDNSGGDDDDDDDDEDIQVIKVGPQKRRQRSTAASQKVGTNAADFAAPPVPPGRDADMAGDAPLVPRITEADIDHIHGFEDVPDPHTGESEMHAVFLLKDGNTAMFPVKEAAMWAPRYMCDYLIKHLHFTTPAADSDLASNGGDEASLAAPDGVGGAVGEQGEMEECKVESVGNDEN